MQIRVLFFGLLKDVTDSNDQTVEVPEGSTIETLFAHFAARYPKLDGLADSIALARNQQFAQPGEVLADGDEIAFLPPVSGGTRYVHRQVLEDGSIVALTREPIDAPALGREVLQGIDGAICTFEGVVRNNSGGRPTMYLDYEGYEGMAMNVMTGLAADLKRNYAISRVAIVHRLGRMQISEASVVVIAAAPHRKPSFEAALEGINRLKKTVPIWKKEYFVDGEVWVDGSWDDSVVRAKEATRP